MAFCAAVFAEVMILNLDRDDGATAGFVVTVRRSTRLANWHGADLPKANSSTYTGFLKLSGRTV